VFALLTIGIVSFATSTILGDQRGWFAGLILLATPSFLLLSSNQMADIPLSLYILTSIVCLRLAESWPEVKSQMLALAGLAAGFAAWTKDEGLLFAIAVLVSQLISGVLLSSWRVYRKDVVKFVVGLAPILVMTLMFKASLAPAGGIRLNAAAIAHITQPERYAQIASAFASEFMTFGSASGGINPIVLMILYLLLCRSPIAKVSYASLSPLLVVAFMVAGYFTVYLITPYDLHWHLTYSLDRLILQLWLVSIFILTTVLGNRVFQNSARITE